MRSEGRHGYCATGACSYVVSRRREGKRRTGWGCVKVQVRQTVFEQCTQGFFGLEADKRKSRSAQQIFGGGKCKMAISSLPNTHPSRCPGRRCHHTSIISLVGHIQRRSLFRRLDGWSRFTDRTACSGWGWRRPLSVHISLLYFLIYPTLEVSAPRFLLSSSSSSSPPSPLCVLQ